MTSQERLLFICTRNSARSQIAEGLMRHRAGNSLQVYSAGEVPAKEIHPLAVKVMDEIGIDIKTNQPKNFDNIPQTIFDYVVSVCDMDLRGCPFVPARKRNFICEIVDPAPLAEYLSNTSKGLKIFRRTREDIEKIVDYLSAHIREPLSDIDNIIMRCTNDNFSGMLADFRQASGIADPIEGGLTMFNVLNGSRFRAKDPDWWRRVFIVHGHDREATDEVRGLVKRTALPVILSDEYGAALTIIEKLEKASTVSAAVILITDDDIAQIVGRRGRMEPRARENVIFEMGYFFAKLGRARVFVIKKGKAALPSDLGGLHYIKMDRRGDWKKKLSSFIERTNKRAWTLSSNLRPPDGV